MHHGAYLDYLDDFTYILRLLAPSMSPTYFQTILVLPLPI